MKRAIISNVVGNILSFVFSLIAIPIQIRVLGVEAYGLIGFIASLQVMLVVLDFGLSSSVVREIAASTDEDLSNKIIQTSATIYWLVSGFIGAGIFFGAEWIASNWLSVETLTSEYVTMAIRILAVYIILTWPVGHYANVLFALKRLDLVNTIKIAVNFISQVGGIGVVLLTRDLSALLIWLTLGALMSVILHLATIKRVFTTVRLGPGFSRLAIRRLWRTSFDMNIVSTASTLYTQLDKVLISSLLPLSFLGYYNIAYRLMIGATLIPSSIGTTTLPTFTEYFVAEQRQMLVDTYNRITQLLLYVLSGFTFGLIFWGRDVITLWASAEAATSAYQPLGILMIGALLNSVTLPAYYLLLATGSSRPLSAIYAAGVLPYGIILVLLIVHAGIIGAALALIVYSMYLIMAMLTYVARQITHEHPVIWLNRVFTPFFLLSAGIFGAGRWILDGADASSPLVVWGIGGICGVLYGVAGFSRLHADSRWILFSTLATAYNTFMKR